MSKTEMVNPPSSSEVKSLMERLDALESENRALRAKVPQEKAAYNPRVKARLLRPVCLSNGATHGPGEEVMMSEEDAKEFCDKSFSTVYGFSGSVEEIRPLAALKRAERVA